MLFVKGIEQMLSLDGQPTAAGGMAGLRVKIIGLMPFVHCTLSGVRKGLQIATYYKG